VNATCMYRISAAVALALAEVSLCQAEELNVFQKECTYFLPNDAALLREETTIRDPFWKEEALRKAFLTARNGGVEAARQGVADRPDQDAARAGVLLVGIFRHDLPMMQISYCNGALSYYDKKSSFSPLTAAVSCGF
jgi:hypothetical protein